MYYRRVVHVLLLYVICSVVPIIDSWQCSFIECSVREQIGLDSLLFMIGTTHLGTEKRPPQRSEQETTAERKPSN